MTDYTAGTKSYVLNHIHCMLQDLKQTETLKHDDFDFDLAFTLIEEVRDTMDPREELRAEALKAITDCWGLGTSPNQFCEQVADFMNEGRAAISKAT